MTVSSPLRPSVCQTSRPRRRAARRPCRRGSSGGCARSSRRSTARTPSRFVPLAAQSREEPVPYSLPAKTTSGTPSCLVAHGGVVDGHLLARRASGWCSRPRRRCRWRPHHLVLDADVGEGAAHHDLVVAAPRAVLVEVGDRDLALEQVLAGRRGRPDVAGRRDVVGRDRVAEEAEDAGVDDVGDAASAPWSCPRNRAGSARRSSRSSHS